MWAQAGFEPDAFWHQTPRHLQLVMQGVRKRMELEAESRTAQAYETGAFSGLASAGKLKAFKHYAPKPERKMSAAEMLANMKILASRANKEFASND